MAEQQQKKRIFLGTNEKKNENKNSRKKQERRKGFTEKGKGVRICQLSYFFHVI